MTEKLALYDRMYPDSCPHCGGTGATRTPATRYEPEDGDVCSCILAARCPRCGQQHTAEWADANLECPNGEWAYVYPCDWCGFTGIEPGRPQPDPYYDAGPVLSGSGYDAETPMYGLPYAGGGYYDD